MATPTKRPLRQDRAMWFLRLLQFILMLCALGIAGKAASVWTSTYDCNVPSRVAWNIACACLTLFYLLYLIPTTGPLYLTKIWNRWVQLSFDGLFVIFWIAAAATSQGDCNDLCNACSRYYNIYPFQFTMHSGDVRCGCSPELVENLPPLSSKRGLDSVLMRRAPISSSSVKGGSKFMESTAEIVAKEGFGGALVFLFIVTLLYGLYKIYEDGKEAKAPQSEHAEAEELNGQNTEYKSEPMVTETRV